MKNYFIRGFLEYYYYKRRVLRTMKISLVLLMLSTFSLFASSSFAQNRSVSLELENVTIKEVLLEIKKQTECSFLYNNEELNDSKRVSIQVKDNSIDKVLYMILKNENLAYTIEDNIIMIHKPKEVKQDFFSAQQVKKQIKGIVVDENGIPIIAANIMEKETANGVVTDIDGNFSFLISENAVIQISYIGYITQEIIITDRNDLRIILKEDLQTLDEIVVVGYGTMRKSDLTGSLASVKSEELTTIPTTSPAQALAGRAAGVYVIPKTGEPGGEVNIRIRGTNSIMGSNEPLYVVDGFPFGGNPSLINNNDIESIEILKDASATAIYGSRGANGVVMITTKKGSSGKTKIEYDGSLSMKRIRKKLDLMNASEYAKMINLMNVNDGVSPYFDNPEAFGKGTDWQDMIFHDAPLWNNNISLSGGDENTKFSIGLGAYDEQGIIKNSGYQKYTVRTNLDHKINKLFDVSFGVNYSRIETETKNSSGGNRGGSMIGGAIGAPPTLTPYNEDGTLRILNRTYSYIADGLVNPLNFIDLQKNKWETNKLLLNGALTVRPINDLTFRFSGGVELNDDRSDSYTMKKFYNSSGSASLSTNKTQSILSENIVTYSKIMNSVHELTAMGGFTYQEFTGKSLSAGGNDFVSDVTETYNLQSASVLGIPYSSFTEWTLLSYLGRINYTLLGKYLFTASFRSDGSSRYSDENKWGYFPSGAFAWRVKEESFLRDIDFISDLKFRISYGVSGSTAISPYQTLNMLASNKAILNDELVTTYAPTNRLPSSLKWETTTQSDIAFDLGLFNNRIRVSADYYIKKTKDLLNSVQIPSSTGYTYTIRNIGEIQNKGFEFNVEGNIIQGDFNWTASANIAFNRNKVLKLNDGDIVRGSTIGITVLNDFVNILKEGEPLGIFYGYKEKGYDDNGKIIYHDLDGKDGLSFDDKQKIGDPNPDFIGGLNTTMTYKGFELNMFFYGSFGNDVFNISNATVNMDYLVGLNKTRDILYDSWTPENKHTKNPRLSKSNPINVSDRFVEDGSFLKLKNIQLGYHIPWSKLGVKWINNGQIYISGQDLITFTKYSWFDPEVNSKGGSASVDLGIDHLTYPTSKSVTVGVKIGF